MAKTKRITNPSGEKKLCPTCMKMLPLFLFQGFPFCMECRNLKGVRQAKTKPETLAGYRLKKYGLTFSEYKRMYFAQKGKCAICGERRELKGNCLPFAIDHDHSSGQVRGLLCNNCNSGLGMFKDRLDNLDNAHKYLLGVATSHME